MTEGQRRPLKYIGTPSHYYPDGTEGIATIILTLQNESSKEVHLINGCVIHNSEELKVLINDYQIIKKFKAINFFAYFCCNQLRIENVLSAEIKIHRFTQPNNPKRCEIIGEEFQNHIKFNNHIFMPLPFKYSSPFGGFLTNYSKNILQTDELFLAYKGITSKEVNKVMKLLYFEPDQSINNGLELLLSDDIFMKLAADGPLFVQNKVIGWYTKIQDRNISVHLFGTEERENSSPMEANIEGSNSIRSYNDDDDGNHGNSGHYGQDIEDDGSDTNNGQDCCSAREPSIKIEIGLNVDVTGSERLVSQTGLMSYIQNNKEMMFKAIEKELPHEMRILGMKRVHLCFIIGTSSLYSLTQLLQSCRNGSLAENLEYIFNDIPQLKEMNNGQDIHVAEAFLEKEEYNTTFWELAISQVEVILKAEVTGTQRLVKLTALLAYIKDNNAKVFNAIEQALPVAMRILGAEIGSIRFIVATSSLYSLTELRLGCKNGSIRKNLEKILNSFPELKEMNNGKDIHIIETLLDREEYNNAFYRLAISKQEDNSRIQKYSKESQDKKVRRHSFSCDGGIPAKVFGSVPHTFKTLQDRYRRHSFSCDRGLSPDDDNHDKDEWPSNRPHHKRPANEEDGCNQVPQIVKSFLAVCFEDGLDVPGELTFQQRKINNEVARALHEIGERLSNLDQLNQLIRDLNVQNNIAFVGVVGQIFHDVNFNWGRIVALFYFGYRLSIQRLSGIMVDIVNYF